MDNRKFKRNERKAGFNHPVLLAYYEGEFLAEGLPHWFPPRLRQNPYPPGRRYDAWNNGYNLADPLGGHHGRNK